MSFVFNKGPEDRTEALRPGEWRRFSGTAVCACPRCGFLAVLDHEIAADGAVSPSVECPKEGCMFHEAGCRLEGWTP